MAALLREFPLHRDDGSFCVSARFETSDDESESVVTLVEEWIDDMESEFPGGLIDDMGRHPRVSRRDGVTAIVFDCDDGSRLWKGWMVALVSRLTTGRPQADVPPIRFVGFFDEVAGSFHPASRYEELGPIPWSEAVESIRGDDELIARQALLRLALHHPDRRAVQDLCLDCLHRGWVMSAAAISLGHLARIHGTIDHERVVPVLQGLLDDPLTGGAASDALDDISTYIPTSPRSPDLEQ